MAHPFDLDFNRHASGLMHLDINSCFASIEQQANPQYRHRPLVVAAYNVPSACIIATSIEAKKLGIKVGLRVKDGQQIYPNLIVRQPDPDKYRFIHASLKKLLSNYSSQICPKSIDEFVVKFDSNLNLFKIAREIKDRLKKEVGNYLTVSVGIGPNRFLAKTASNLHKPDGLDEINLNNFRSIYSSLKLTDLCGLKNHSAIRLNQAGIFSLLDFYQAPAWKLKSAFHSVIGYYWYLRLRGWEVDDFPPSSRTYSQSYVLAHSTSIPTEIYPVLQKLTEKMAYRIRSGGYQSRAVDLAFSYQDHSFWHQSISFSSPVFDSRDFFKKYLRLFSSSPQKSVKKIAIAAFYLQKMSHLQLDLFGQTDRQFNLIQSLDIISRRYGRFIITPATMLGTQNLVPDRIAFGNIDIGL